jgi:hypothetical protein
MPDSWSPYLGSFLNYLMAALPWLVGAGVFAVVGYASPLGRALLRYLRDHRRDAELTEEMLLELQALRGTLGEVVERLDGTERLLNTASRNQLSKPIVELTDPDRIPTPV